MRWLLYSKAGNRWRIGKRAVGLPQVVSPCNSRFIDYPLLVY
jgi:hypothetical protein